MADLKLDLLNKINNDKYFAEIELVRLASDPNMNYENKIYQITDLFTELATLNAQLGMVDEYFKEPAKQQSTQPPTGQVHQGQSHGE